jgi:DNA-binding response OmpR family regulator
MNTILLVEDDASLNRGISFKLGKEGYLVFSAKTIADARAFFNDNKIDLILLDVGLPDGNGFDFCREIRKSNDTLIIFLTACDQEVDIVTGLDIGADDYIVKPFSLMVLMSKINALLRRNQDINTLEVLKSGEILFNLSEMSFFKGQDELILSKTEIKLLKYLMENAKQVITKDQLLNQLWDVNGNFVDKNTIAVNIRRLREKIENNPSKPQYIKKYAWNRIYLGGRVCEK